MHDDDDDPWLDEDVADNSIVQQNSKREWEHLETKFSDVRRFAGPRYIATKLIAYICRQDIVKVSLQVANLRFKLDSTKATLQRELLSVGRLAICAV